MCDKRTIGLLQRRHILINSVTAIGKESNRLEEVDAGLIHSEADAYTVYSDPQRDLWETKIRPALKKIPLAALEEKTGICRRALIDLREGFTKPHPKNRERLAIVVRELGAEDI